VGHGLADHQLDVREIVQVGWDLEHAAPELAGGACDAFELIAAPDDQHEIGAGEREAAGERRADPSSAPVTSVTMPVSAWSATIRRSRRSWPRSSRACS
jgi:hypothetical protein